MDRGHAQRRLHRDETADARVAALELLADEPVTDGVKPGAVVAADRGAEEALAGEPRDQLARKAMLLEAALDDRQPRSAPQPGARVLHQPLLFGERGAYPEEIERIEAYVPGGGLDGFGGF